MVIVQPKLLERFVAVACNLDNSAPGPAMRDDVGPSRTIRARVFGQPCDYTYINVSDH